MHLDFFELVFNLEIVFIFTYENEQKLAGAKLCQGQIKLELDFISIKI